MSSYKRKKTPANTDWLVQDRFGMFIHFGLYALPARHEWIKTMEEMDDEAYDRYFENFNPDLFDAREWARAAKAAGMKYAVLTSKHHEGFCLFDSQYTDYKITNTPFGRDLIAEYVEAFREAGLKVGIYYSLIDWHHPHFPIDVIHPQREHPDGAALDSGRDMKIYAEYMRNQVRELLTNYGKIDILWFDFAYPNPDVKQIFGFAKGITSDPNPKPWMQYNGAKGPEHFEAEKLIALAREVSPDTILNDRTGIPQDVTTPEQSQPTSWMRDRKSGELLTWEVCHTFSGSWGYNRDEATWKSPKMLIDTLIKTVACGGNLLMNVGPTSRGRFDKRAVRALEAYGEWMEANSRSMYGCTLAEPEFKAPRGTALTQSEDGKRLYVHFLEYPFATFDMPELLGRVKYAQFLSDGSEVLYKEKTLKNHDTGETYTTLAFTLPVIPPDEITPVIEIVLN